MNFSKRDKVVNVQFAGIGKVATGERIVPATGHNLAAPCIQGDRNQTFFDQDFLTGVLAVTVCINPSPVQLSVITNGPGTRCRWRG